MTSSQSPATTPPSQDVDKPAPSSFDELDLSTSPGLRQLHRMFILQDPGADRLIPLFPQILASASRADKNQEFQLAALDALSIWLLRATRTNNPSTTIAPRVSPSEWDNLISLSWIRWASAPNSNAIQKIIKELFSKTLVLQRVLFSDWKEREIGLLERVLLLAGMDLKIQCHLIEVLVRRAPEGAKRVLELRNTWVIDMLGEMKDSSNGPAVGKCLVGVLMTRRKELLDEDPQNGHDLWLETWKEPLLATISGSEESHIRLLNKYFLPTLSKECPHAFNDLLQSMANDILEKKQTSGLQAFMLCLNIARREKLLPDDGISTLTAFLSVAILAFTDLGLPSSFFHSLLTTTSFTIRVSAFDFPTFHTHQKMPLSKPCFHLIQSVLPSLFAEQDGEFRIEILRSIRALILRIRASTHSTSKELEKRTSKLGNIEAELTLILTEAGDFVKWLVGFCGECICPGRSYYTCSMALKTLHVLCEEGFFTDLEVEVKSGVLSGVHVELFSSSMLRLLLDRLADGYDEVAKLACSLIERIKDPTRIPWKSLYDTGRELCLSRRADKAEGGARALSLCQHFGKVNGYTNVWEDIWDSLVEDVKTGNLQLVAGEKPLHGRLVALRSIPRDSTSNIVNRAHELCEQIWDLVSPVLTHDSPEGTLLNGSTNPSALRESAAQDLLSSSWRSLKEASALLGTVLSSPTSTLEQYQSAGALFMEWLTRIRHRGAFSAVMPAFENLCTECFKDTSKNLKLLPPKWLNECLSSMTTMRSITRRSGGLPMLIIAILISETDGRESQVTKLALKRLLDLADTPVDLSELEGTEPGKWDLPQVHAQNTMRAIFMESKLAQTTFGFVESGFGSAIKGFSSDVYPIRNSSITLFDALLFRAMGQKYARQDIDPSAPNRSVSSKVFFSKFPKLHKYLLDELSRDVSLLEQNEDIVNTGLYPILTLLARLDVTRLAESRKYTGMQPFRQLIHRCMGAKIWKARAMAARCLPGVLDPDTLPEDIADIFAAFKLDAQNELHGRLLGVKRLAEFYSYRTLKDDVFGAILSGMEGSLEFVLCKNGNPLTKAAFVEIAHFVFNCEDKARALVQKVLTTCLGDLGGGRNESVGWQLYLEQAASLVLDAHAKNIDFKGMPSDVVEMLLQNDNEEVVMKTLSWMNNSKSECSSTPELRQALRFLICQNKWDGVCALVLRVIPGVFGDDEQGFSLAECIRGYQGNQVMPVREGWIAVAGFAARTEYMNGTIDQEMLSTYFKILSAACESSQPESTRLAALRSLQTFSPILHLALQNPETSAEVIPAFFTLLLFLTDDDSTIRRVASEITSSILGEYMASTPMSASEKLAESIGEAFNPEPLEQIVVDLILGNNVRQKFRVALDPDDDLFAKERENVWRDEVHMWGLYTRILSMCWSRGMSLELEPMDLGLERWAVDGLEAVKKVIEMKEDTPLGWSQDVDLFESVVKLFMVVEILLRYGRGSNLGNTLEPLKRGMGEKKCHGFWVEKIVELGYAKGVCSKVANGS